MDIQSEFERLAEKFRIPAPKWKIIPGETAYFDHSDQYIYIGKELLKKCENDEHALRYLLSHEFRHWYQWYKNFLQSFQSLREADAHRAAMDETYQRLRVLPILERPTPVIDSIINELDSRDFPIKDFCRSCGRDHGPIFRFMRRKIMTKKEEHG